MMTSQWVAIASMVVAIPATGWTAGAISVIDIGKSMADGNKIIRKASCTFTHPTLDPSLVELTPPINTKLKGDGHNLLREGDSILDEYGNTISIGSGQTKLKCDVIPL